MKIAIKWHQFIICDITDLLDGRSDDNRHQMTSSFSISLLYEGLDGV